MVEGISNQEPSQTPELFHDAFTIAPIQPAEWEIVQEICLETAGFGESNDEAGKRFTLLMYCRWYLENGLALVLHTCNRQVGYILCAEDYAHYETTFAPYLAEIEQLGGMYPFMARAEMQVCQRYATEYPAHLHIVVMGEHSPSITDRICFSISAISVSSSRMSRTECCNLRGLAGIQEPIEPLATSRICKVIPCL